MTIRNFRLILVGALLASGLTFIIVGFQSRDSLGSYIEAKYLPPIFNVPDEVNKDFAIDVIDRTNIERKKVNLPLLKESSALSYSAYLRAKDILKFQDFSHEATKSGDRTAFKVMEIVSYMYDRVGENLAMGIPDPNKVVARLMASPEHRDNILSKDFNETGVAVLNGSFQGQDNTDIVVQLFGKR